MCRGQFRQLISADTTQMVQKLLFSFTIISTKISVHYVGGNFECQLPDFVAELQNAICQTIFFLKEAIGQRSFVKHVSEIASWTFCLFFGQNLFRRIGSKKTLAFQGFFLYISLSTCRPDLHKFHINQSLQCICWRFSPR